MTAQNEDRPEPHIAPEDNRPEFRVALFGVGAKFQRMLEIVARHAMHNPYRFSLAENRSTSNFDIAMVDMTVTGGPEVAGTLKKLLHGRPVLKLGRRADPDRPCDDVVHESFAAQILLALNGFAERHLNAQASAEGARALSDLVKDVAQQAANVEGGRVGGRRPRALIVDDSPTVRRQLSVALHQMGIDSEAVTSGREALDVLSLREYELVFADVIMPEQDGYQLTRQIKRDRSLKGMPVIILTSRSSPFDLARGALAGCSSYLVKPVSLQSLRDTVHRQLRKVLPRRKGAVDLMGLI